MSLSSHDELILLRKRARRRLVGAVVLVGIASAVLWNVVGHLPDQQMKPESIEILGASSAPAAEASAPKAAHAASAPVASAPLAVAAAAKPQTSTELPANLSTVTEPVAAPAKPAAREASHPAAQAKPEPRIEPKPEAKAETHKPEHKAEAKPEAKPKPEKPAHKADPAAILEGRADPDAAPKPAKESKGQSIVQLAALSDPAKVDALRAKLSSLGVSAHFSKVETSKGEVTRVRVGPFASQAEAQSMLQKLSKAGVSGILITK